MANEILKIEDAEQLEITDACVMKVTAGTNGFKGGDSGHGSRTVVILEDEGSVDWGVIVDGVKHSDPRKVTISLGGDAELRTIIRALKFAANSLSKRAGFDEAKENAENRLAMFNGYIQDLIRLFQDNGNLKGMSEVRSRWGCTGITKQDFFMLGLDKRPKGETYMSRDYTDKVFDYITGKTSKRPSFAVNE